MRNSINCRNNVVVFGNRQVRVAVVAGHDPLRALADAHLLVSRPGAKSYSCKSIAAHRRATRTETTACRAGERCAGIPARQRCWQAMHRLPQAPSSRS